jgi:methionyl-tRNA synthetase
MTTDLLMSNDDFVRTTEARHRAEVERVWRGLREAGCVKEGSYEGWYCVSDEAFVPDSQSSPGPGGSRICSETGRPLVRVSERTHCMSLEPFKGRIAEWLSRGGVVPANRAAEVTGWLRGTLPDVSLSRPRSRVPWGISVPEDDTATVYVWLDALTNYLTAGDGIGPDHFVHVVGKDILRFHAVYWPAFLMGRGLPAPRSVVCHAHWTVDGVKMSKSLGNFVTSDALMARYGSMDPVRYYLLRDGDVANDSDFNDGAVVARWNGEGAGVLGNLVGRSVADSICDRLLSRPEGRVVERNPRLLAEDPAAQALLASARKAVDRAEACFAELDFAGAIAAAVDLARQGNQYYSEKALWKCRESEEVSHTLHTVFEAVRVSATLLHPVIPKQADEILVRIGLQPIVTATGTNLLLALRSPGPDVYKPLRGPFAPFKKITPPPPAAAVQTPQPKSCSPKHLKSKIEANFGKIKAAIAGQVG